jgi:hypothetical protein
MRGMENIKLYIWLDIGNITKSRVKFDVCEKKQSVRTLY